MFRRADAVERRGIDVTNAGVPGGAHDRLTRLLADVEAPSRERRGAEADLRHAQVGAADLTLVPCGHGGFSCYEATPRRDSSSARRQRTSWPAAVSVSM